MDPNISYDCGSKCINSIISIECDPHICPCKEKCQNRKFQRHQNAPVYPVQFGEKGFGLVAGEFIPKETFIIQYIGEVVSLNSEEGKKRLNDYQKSTCTYMMRLSAKEVIDPTYYGNMARLINHSCDPNCETRKWNVDGEIEVGIISVKDIHEGEELTFDYKFDVYQTPYTRCLCGTSKCKGYLGLVPVEYTAEQWEEKMDNLPCEICGNTTESESNQLLLCDICNNGYHMHCCEPPLVSVPSGAWFCTKCSKQGASSVDMQENAKKEPEQIVEEKIDSKPAVQSKPVKQLLMNSKALRGWYSKYRRKDRRAGRGDQHKNWIKSVSEYDSAYIKEYLEFYEYQSDLQFDVVCEFLDEMKAEKKEGERIVREKYAPNSEKQPIVAEAVSKGEIPATQSAGVGKSEDRQQQEEEDDGETEASFEIPHKTSHQAQQPSTPKAKNLETKTEEERVKQQIMEEFLKKFETSQVKTILKNKSQLSSLNDIEGTVSRNVMLVSVVELNIFKTAESIKKTITQGLNAKLFWNNSHASDPDMFAKTVEFSVTGTPPQFNFIKDLFKVMEDGINSYKKLAGFTKARIKIPAIFLKRLLGEFQKNL